MTPELVISSYAHTDQINLSETLRTTLITFIKDTLIELTLKCRL